MAPRLTARISPAQTSSRVPAYRHTATVSSPSFDLEDVAVSEPGLGDGRGGIEDVAGLVAHRERSVPLGRQAPGPQLAGQLLHGALIRSDDDTAHEGVAREAEQVDAHRGILKPSERGSGATGRGRGAGPCRSRRALRVPSTCAGR